ncbi:MAG: GNAT family N-acetyltransferase [Mobilitalea sp.]
MKREERNLNMHLANENIEIRLITEADLIENREKIIDLLEENLKINFPTLNNLKNYAISGYEDMLCFSQDKTAILIGAFDRKTTIGFLWAYKRTLLGEDRIHLDHIVVDATIRAVGIGSRLLRVLEEIAIDKGILKIELMTTIENENTMRFYKSKGFSTTRVLLEKELGGTDDN